MLLISLIFQRHREDALKVMLSLTHLEDEVTEGALISFKFCDIFWLLEILSRSRLSIRGLQYQKQHTLSGLRETETDFEIFAGRKLVRHGFS